MAALWPIYTLLHGATSYYERGVLLGFEGQTWGFLMDGPSTALVALGLIGLREILTRTGGRAVRLGLGLTLVALLVSALFDFATLAIGPPLLAPLLAVGLVGLALGNRANVALPVWSQRALWGLAIVVALSFAWAILVPMDISDRIGGYRIYGLLANLLVGVGWFVFGACLWLQRRAG